MNKIPLSLSVFLLGALLPFAGCGPQRQKATYAVIDGFAQGSTYHIVYGDPQGRNLQRHVEELLEQIDHSLSVYNPGSTLSLLNANDTTVVPDKRILDCLRIAQQISEDTDGAFDVTLRPLIAAYRIGTDEKAHVPSDREITAMRPYIGYRKVRIEGDKIVKDDPRIQFDFNAIAQGYTADRIGAMFDSLQVKNYLVEIGGEIYCRGKNAAGKDWRVGIDRPVEGNLIPGKDLQVILAVTDRGLVTSGNYRKFAYDENGVKVVHTIDPKTMRPAAHNLLSATILAPTAMQADGYATACMVIGLERSKRLLERNTGLEGYLVYGSDDGTTGVYATPGMKKHVQKN